MGVVGGGWCGGWRVRWVVWEVGGRWVVGGEWCGRWQERWVAGEVGGVVGGGGGGWCGGWCGRWVAREQEAQATGLACTIHECM